MLEKLTMFEPAQVAPEIFSLPAWCPVPGLGILPINAFVVRGSCPILIDTGVGPLKEEFMDRLGSVIDPGDLHYIWLTHADPDHTGAIERLLDAAPRARVVTSFLGAAKMSFYRPIPEDRLHLLNPGERLDIGGRELVAIRPPTYDAPETIAAFDPSSRTLFAADSFGALLEEPAGAAGEVAPARLRDGLVTWAGIDSPWLADLDQARFAATLESFRQLAPEIVLGSHLPPAGRMIGTLLEYLAAAPAACARSVPDQSAADAVKTS